MKLITYLKENYWLTALLFIGLLLRLFRLDYQSLWLDEVHTMIEANPQISFKESYDILAFREQMPQLYFMAVKLLNTILGHTVFTTRLFSVIVGVVSIGAIYLLGSELKNKKTGLIAALFLSVNYFHLLYSQEARPYALFALMTILSFYRLVIFIKKYNVKNALYYGLFAALTIDTHFFGLFILVAQALIILFFLFDIPERKQRFLFFRLAVLSGFITIVLWLPSLKVFFDVLEIKSFWIQAPTLEVYTQMCRDFFGNSEALLFLVLLLTLFYFFNLFQQKQNSTVVQNKWLLSFVVLVLWIFVTLFIPLVRSYLDVPMIISRYFITVLPAILLIAAIAVDAIKAKLVRNTLLILFVVISLTDIIIVKDYYSKVSKTQFREITETIKKRNKKGEKVVSSFGWLMSYFLNQDPTRKPLLEARTTRNVCEENTLEGYIAAMRNNAVPLESFWYLDGNSRPYQLSAEDEKFLTDNFTVTTSIAQFDTWAKHYQSKTITAQKITDAGLSIKNFQPANFDASGNINLYENSTIKSSGFYLEKGKYQLVIEANSLPEQPIQGQNAHITVKLGDKEIGNYYVSEQKSAKQKAIVFENTVNQNCKIAITFDNDIAVGNADRNLIIYSIALEKK